MKKFMVVEDFFQNFQQIKDEFKKIPRFEYKEHPDIKPKLEELEKQKAESSIKYYWPGERSEDLKKTNKFLTALFLKEYDQKFGNFMQDKLGFALYTHLRLKKHKASDWPHKDSPDSKYSLLVYLSNTNLNSGTRLYDDMDTEVANINFVQNRAVIFDSTYTHAAINNHGENEDDRRLTLNVLWNDIGV